MCRSITNHEARDLTHRVCRIPALLLRSLSSTITALPSRQTAIDGGLLTQERMYERRRNHPALLSLPALEIRTEWKGT
jgi:hypothetical protein